MTTIASIIKTRVRLNAETRIRIIAKATRPARVYVAPIGWLAK